MGRIKEGFFKSRGRCSVYKEEYERLQNAVSSLRRARLIREDEALDLRHRIESLKEEEAKSGANQD